MKTWDLKKAFNEKCYGLNKGFKFEITFSNSGVARIFIGDRKTKYSADGYGYDKVSSVIANMINDLIGEQSYNKEVYGNTGNYNKDKEVYLLSGGGVGFGSIKDSFESIDGNKLVSIYSGVNSSVYEVTFK